MAWKIKLCLAILALIFSIPASANTVFTRGFVLSGSQLIQTTERLDSNSLLVCNPACDFANENRKIQIPFSGFGRYEDLLSLGKGAAAPPPAIEEQKMKPKDTPRKPPPADLAKYEVPYPKNGTVYLLKKASRIYLYPRANCSSECQISFQIKGKRPENFSFQSGDRPLASVTLEGSGEATMTFTEGATKLEADLGWKPFSPENLKSAIFGRHTVEIP